MIRVKKSPFREDENLPWDYEPDAFCAWVWEVFLEGYKRDDVPCPTLEVAISYLSGMGFDIVEVPSLPRKRVDV
jgi:hypothetical protein